MTNHDDQPTINWHDVDKLLHKQYTRRRPWDEVLLCVTMLAVVAAVLMVSIALMSPPCTPEFKYYRFYPHGERMIQTPVWGCKE